MIKTPLAITLIAVIGLGACGQRSYLDSEAASGAGVGNPGALGAIGADAPLDPSSPAFFNQTVGDRVLFAVDISTLSPEARAILDAQAAWLIANPEYTAIIEGHADEQGTREYNLALGARRAASVEQYLIAQGVSAARLETISYGKERPLAICSSEECYQQNRRAVTVIAAAGLG